MLAHSQPIEGMGRVFRRLRNRLSADAYSAPGHVHFTLCTFRRRPLFRDGQTADETRRILHDSFTSDPRLDAYCFMPDHLHVLVATSGGADVRMPLAHFKRASAHAYWSRTGDRLWQRGFHDRVLRSDDERLRTIIYILDNPVRRGLCAYSRDWTYSWSRGPIDE